jgi:hypothetical protein
MSLRQSIVSSITRMYPFYSGRGMLANSYWFKLLAPPSAGLVWTQSVAGKVQVPLDDYVGRALYFFRDLDPKVTWAIRRILKPGTWSWT